MASLRDDMSALGGRLELARKAARLSVKKLATLIGRSHTALLRYESGETVCDVSILRLIAEHTGADEAWLLNGTGRAPVPTPKPPKRRRPTATR